MSLPASENIDMAESRCYNITVYYICLVAALGGLLFGLDQGFIANSLDTIRDVYHLDIAGGGKYSAMLATGGVIGAALSGVFARVFGRKKSLMLAGFIFSLASLFSAFLPSLVMLNACRFFLGFGVGVSSFVVPLYLSETTPAAIRGSMGTLFQLMITIGILLISITNVFIARTFITPTVALPLMFLVITLFAILMFIGSFMLPESPRWLMLKGKKSEALNTLKRIFGSQDEIDTEVKEIEATLSATKKVGISVVFKGYFLKVLFIGVFLQIFQQLVGINAIIYYAPTIFGYAGMQGIVALLAVPVVNMIFTLPAIRLVEKWGRKKLLYVGAVFMLITMLAAGLVFQHIGNVADAAVVSDGSKMVLLATVIIYIFGFAVSWGPVVWIVCSEIFPLKGREIGMTITTIVNWTFAGILMRYALSFMEVFGKAPLFYVFALFCMIAIIFVALFVPETKGVTLEQLESRLTAKK